MSKNRVHIPSGPGDIEESVKTHFTLFHPLRGRFRKFPSKCALRRGMKVLPEFHVSRSGGLGWAYSTPFHPLKGRLSKIPFLVRATPWNERAP